jgi:uncharacterized protein
MDNPIQVDLGRIAQDLQIRRLQVESVVGLLDEGNTVPFITRYRKEQTGNLNELVIGEIQLRVRRLREVAERKETILKAIEAQGKLVPDLATAIRAADNLKRLEDLYLPFKPKKRTKASDARDRGLEPLAFRVWTRDETLTDLPLAAQEFVSAEAGVESVDKVIEGVGHILAEAISEMATVRDAIRKFVWKTGRIVTARSEIPEGQGLEYRDYFNYSEPVAQIPPHRVLAINRGDKEGPLKVRLEVPRPEAEAVLFGQLPLENHPHGDVFRAAAVDSLDRLILPSMEREVRRDLSEAAERHAVEVFAKNLRSLLLQPPIAKLVVLAIDPGFKTGCKLAVLDRNGALLDHAVVYPHPPQNRRSDAKLVLKDLVGKHQVGVVAIGNGTACRETEELIAEIIAEGIQFSQSDGAANGVATGAPPADQAHPPSESGEQGEQLAGTTGAHPSQSSPDHDHGDHASAGASPSESPHPPSVEHAPFDPHETAQCDTPSVAESQAVSELSAVPSAQSEASPELQAARSVESRPAPDPHASLTAETPLEALPPISGGAPDSSSPEAQIDASSSSSGPAEPPSTTVHDNAGRAEHHDPDTGAAEAITDAGADSQPCSEPIITPVPPDSQPSFEGVPQAASPELPPESAGDSLAAPVAAVTTQGEAPPGEQPAEPASHAASEQAETPAGEPAPEATTPASAQAEQSRGAAAPLARGPRSGSHGKQDSSRSRPPRNKHSPPPVQEPPKPHPADAALAQLAYVVVNEAGASVYSTSQVGREELPDCDATLRSGISIGRRLQDPLAELVKIEPQNIGVGLYQHDVNPKQLKETLEAVISSCVNFVGVDLNTASASLLRHVAGLNQLTARRIVEYRKEHGPFAAREQLMQVEGIGPASYTQAAGFLKISDGQNPLDRTWIHPESYAAAAKLLEKLGFEQEVVRDKTRATDLRTRLHEGDLFALARELDLGEFTLRDMIEALARPERDPRDDLPKPIFKKGILKLEDLSAGMELKGTVLNVVDFGAFVDIGLKDSGLVHISQLANRYVKSPHDVVSVGDVVTVWVMGVDQERKRVSLTMVKPGMERQRGPGAGSRRGGPEGEPRDRDPRQARRGNGGPRPPRPTASALTSPPVGAPSVATLAETPARRSDRGRGGPGTASGPAGPRPGDPRGQQPGGSSGSAPAGGGPPRHGAGSGPPRGRGGGARGPYTGPSSGQPRQDRGPANRPPNRPSRPAPPPPPLSKDALAGNVPLRTFGQLKQLWQARTDGPPGPADQTPESFPQTTTDHPPVAPVAPVDPTEPIQVPATSAPDTEPRPASNSF